MIVSFWTDAVRRLTTSQIFWTLNQNFSIPRRDGRKHACIVMRTQPWRRRPKALRELTGAKHGLVMHWPWTRSLTACTPKRRLNHARRPGIIIQRHVARMDARKAKLAKAEEL